MVGLSRLSSASDPEFYRLSREWLPLNREGLEEHSTVSLFPLLYLSRLAYVFKRSASSFFLNLYVLW